MVQIMDDREFHIKIKHPDGMITTHMTFSLAAAFVVFREEVTKDKNKEREISLYCGIYNAQLL